MSVPYFPKTVEAVGRSRSAVSERVDVARQSVFTILPQLAFPGGQVLDLHQFQSGLDRPRGGKHLGGEGRWTEGRELR